MFLAVPCTSLEAKHKEVVINPQVVTLSCLVALEEA